MTTLVVLCLILKLFLVLDKLGARGQDKNWNSCPPLNYMTTFWSTKHRITQNLFNTINVCLVLFCPVSNTYPIRILIVWYFSDTNIGWYRQVSVSNTYHTRYLTIFELSGHCLTSIRYKGHLFTLAMWDNFDLLL
jgi:hypothetical protein